MGLDPLGVPCLVSAPSSSQRLGSRLPSAFSVKVSLNLRHSTSLFSESALKLCLSPSCLPFHHQGKMWDYKDSVFCLKSQIGCENRKILAINSLRHSKLQKVIVRKLNENFQQTIDYQQLTCQPKPAQCRPNTTPMPPQCHPNTIPIPSQYQPRANPAPARTSQTLRVPGLRGRRGGRWR